MNRSIKISMNNNTTIWLKAVMIFAGIMLFFCMPMIFSCLFGQEVAKKIVFGGLGLGGWVFIVWIIKMWINDE